MLAAIVFGLSLGIAVGLLTGITGCTQLAPELDSATPAFTPRAAVIGTVDGLPGPLSPEGDLAPQAMFGCDLGQPCKVAGLSFTVRDYGDAMAILTFDPSTFCGKIVMPVEHTSQSNFVQIGLHWDQDREAYVALDNLSASAPGAEECWAGNSAIFTIRYNVVREVAPPKSMS